MWTHGVILNFYWAAWGRSSLKHTWRYHADPSENAAVAADDSDWNRPEQTAKVWKEKIEATFLYPGGSWYTPEKSCNTKCQSKTRELMRKNLFFVLMMVSKAQPAATTSAPAPPFAFKKWWKIFFLWEINHSKEDFWTIQLIKAKHSSATTTIIKVLIISVLESLHYSI